MVSLSIFISGIIIGSFLNSLIWRTKSGKSIFRGRSQCIHCDRSLLVRDLVPFFSFLLLRGRCRYCRKKISWQYPAVELVTGASFVLIWQSQENLFPVLCGSSEHCLITATIFYFLAVSLLIVLATLDLRYLLLPAKFSIFGAIVAFFTNLYFGWSLYNLILAVALGFVFFALQHFVSRGRWVGGGDMYMGAFIGATLGLPKVLLAILIAYILGAAVALILIGIRKATFGSKLPMGVFLSISTFIVMMWGGGLLKILNF